MHTFNGKHTTGEYRNYIIRINNSLSVALFACWKSKELFLSKVFSFFVLLGFMVIDSFQPNC